MTIDRDTLRQIARAVEGRGGNVEDVRDLRKTWERLHEGVREAAELAAGSDEKLAEAKWRALDRDYGKPLDDIVVRRIGNGGPK